MPSRKIGPSHFSSDVSEFLQDLVDHGVEFMVVGGEAVILHGYSRVTGDIDIFYSLSADNTERLFAALRRFWGGRVPGVHAASSLAEGVIVQFGVPPNRIDLINRIDGVSFQEAWGERVRVTIEGSPRKCSVSFIGLHSLLKNKKASGRPKDMDDLRYLEAASRKMRTTLGRRSAHRPGAS